VVGAHADYAADMVQEDGRELTISIFRVKVHFDQGSPDPERLVEGVHRRTGLEIELTKTGDSLLLSNESFANPCDVRIQPNDVFLYCGQRVSYLEWCTLACLVDMGGQYNGKIPSLVNTRWAKRRWWQRLLRG
jgi:hypothetical protein